MRAKAEDWHNQYGLGGLRELYTRTAAEVMEAEMPIGWVGGLNTAAGPTYAEVWWREWENELEERRV
mgnify:CR=1 FL=1